jgi:glycosyltransferase involved in cell wall biosynthesis/GT2 family glycosyltransferase
VSHSAVVDAWRERERELRALGHEVRLLSAQRWNEGGSFVDLQPRPGEDVEGVRTWGSHPALFLYDPRPLWRALAQPWDLIDIHEEPFALSTAEVLLLRALRRSRTPYVVYSAQNLDKRYPVPFRWLERWVLRHAAGASVCNAEAGRILQRKGMGAHPSLIPLGTDLRTFRPGGRGAAGSQRGDQPVTVAYAGRLEPHKGVSVLLDAVAGSPRLRLLLAGAGPSDPALREQARRLGLGDRVTFGGPLDPDGLADLFRSADVVAVPSLTTDGWVEQFGRVALEAMACGVPVVASDSGALPDVVGGAGILVPPGDATALREALVRVGTDRALADELREKALRRARGTSWEAVAAGYDALYRRALAPTPPAPSTSEHPLEVLVVAYGSPDLLRRALLPLRDETVTVIDNSSSPEVRQVCAETGVLYLDPGWNGGFAAGVNEGLRHRRHPDSDVLLLNPDAVIEPDGVRRLHEALRSDPTLASVGPAQLDEDGHPSRVGWPFPSPRGAWLDAVGLGPLRRAEEYVIGSVLLLRAEALEQLGGLDERFFLYAEETDWAYRASRLGWHHRVVPSVVALHVGGATSSSSKRREILFHASQEHYMRKHFGAAGWAVARGAHLAGASVRSLLPGERGRAARDRFGLFLHGPVRLERPHRPTARVPDGMS